GGLLPAPSRHARAVARSRAGGEGTRLGAWAAGAGARARLIRLLARLLPDRALAHRPDSQRPRARALPARGPARAAGHRPRLPSRCSRGPDTARARALRARSRSPRGGLSDLPRARGDPRARQGAGPAAGRDRAPGSRRRGPRTRRGPRARAERSIGALALA